MVSKITLLVTLATYICIFVYSVFALRVVVTGPIGFGCIIILIFPVLLTFTVGSIIIAKNTDIKPVLNIAAYIILTIGLLGATNLINDTIRKKNYAANKAKNQEIYAEVSEKGECLNRSHRFEPASIYYFNDKLYKIHFSNNEVSNIFIRNPEHYDGNDYIRVYEVNKKYTLMLEKTALNDFNNWIIYVDNIGYFHLGDHIPFYGIMRYEHNEYTILDEELHTKILERAPSVFQKREQ